MKPHIKYISTNIFHGISVIPKVKYVLNSKCFTYLVLFSDLALFKLLHYGVGQYIQKPIKINIYTSKKSCLINT